MDPPPVKTNDFTLSHNAVFVEDDSPVTAATRWDNLAAVPIVVDVGVGIIFKMPPGSRVIKTDCAEFATKGDAECGYTVDMRSVAVRDDDVDLVTAQVVSADNYMPKAAVVNALLKHKGDIVEAIMELSV